MEELKSKKRKLGSTRLMPYEKSHVPAYNEYMKDEGRGSGVLVSFALFFFFVRASGTDWIGAADSGGRV
jgi:hypothetical protein